MKEEKRSEFILMEKTWSPRITYNLVPKILRYFSFNVCIIVS